MRAGGVQRCVARPAGRVCGGGENLGHRRAETGGHRREEDSAAGMAGRGGVGGVGPSLSGRASRVSELVRFTVREAEGPQGRGSAVPVSQGHSAVDPAHSERVRYPGQREVVYREGRRTESRLVTGVAVGAEQRHGREGFGGPLFRVVRGGDHRCAVAGVRCGGGDRSGFDDVCGPLGWEGDRVAEVLPPGRTQTPQGAAESVSQGEGQQESGQGTYRAAKAHARVADARKDWAHKQSTAIVRENQAVYVEDLCVVGLARTRLAKSVHDAGWGMFTRLLEEKAARYGRVFQRVDRWFPSSRLCSVCGVSDGPKPLSVRVWTCQGCGVVHDRDLNAARNILAAGRAERRNACGETVSLSA